MSLATISSIWQMTVSVVSSFFSWLLLHMEVDKARRSVVCFDASGVPLRSSTLNHKDLEVCITIEQSSILRFGGRG